MLRKLWELNRARPDEVDCQRAKPGNQEVEMNPMASLESAQMSHLIIFDLLRKC